MSSQQQLHEAIRFVQDFLDQPARWTSLVINKRKPHTDRVSIQWGENRICLHRFEPCEAEESLAHPHPWPSAMLILFGTYEMRVSQTGDLESAEPRNVMNLVLGPGSLYEMSDRHTWHQVIPRTECYSVMVNGPRWENAHRCAPSTSGKQLQELRPEQLEAHLYQFQVLIKDYLEQSPLITA